MLGQPCRGALSSGRRRQKENQSSDPGHGLVVCATHTGSIPKGALEAFCLCCQMQPGCVWTCCFVRGQMQVLLGAWPAAPTVKMGAETGPSGETALPEPSDADAGPASREEGSSGPADQLPASCRHGEMGRELRQSWQEAGTWPRGSVRRRGTRGRSTFSSVCTSPESDLFLQKLVPGTRCTTRETRGRPGLANSLRSE